MNGHSDYREWFYLAHSLKSSYKDFLEFCYERNRKRIPSMINYGTTFIASVGFKFSVFEFLEYFQLVFSGFVTIFTEL